MMNPENPDDRRDLMNERILVVDDEKPIVKLVTYHLEREGFKVTPAYDGEEALRLLRSGEYDFVVLDIMIPKVSGWDVLRIMRREGLNAPVLLLSARSDEADRVAGLELGADDYVTKPFSPRELVARVRAHLRRVSQEFGEKVQTVSYGPIEIHVQSREAFVNGSSLDLTTKEFDLLLFMAQQPGKVFTRDQLLSKVWGYDFQGDSRTVDVHVSRLRQKIEPLAGETLFETVRGVGYRLRASGPSGR